jgi:hypothetical protein
MKSHTSVAPACRLTEIIQPLFLPHNASVALELQMVSVGGEEAAGGVGYRHARP